jgi:glycosyltransferase involved in cell wall biosynthesis
MKEPKVSVIIPTYNRANYISECIESVLIQTFGDYEIIVVDDGSDDNTREVLETYAKKINYFYQENSGPSCSRNKGILKAKGDFIAFLDSDDLWKPEKLEKSIPIIEGYEGVGIVFTNVVFQDFEGNIARVTEYDCLAQDEIKNQMMERTLIVTSSAIIRKSVVKDVGLFDESLTYGEDWDMFYRIVRKYQARIVKDKLTIYRSSKDSMLANKEKREKLIYDTFRVIERIYSYPENVGQAHKKKTFYGRYYRELGEEDLFNGDVKNARKYFLRSLNYEKNNSKTYLLFFKSYLRNTGLYEYMRKLKKYLLE